MNEPTRGGIWRFVDSDCSIAVTSAAYAYRISVEDAMLLARFGASYESYSREVGAVIPCVLLLLRASKRR